MEVIGERMNNDEISTLLVETSERAKSNTHQIEEVKDDMKDVKAEQKNLSDLISSIKVIAEKVTNINSKVDEIKVGQRELSDNQKEMSDKFDNKIDEVKKDQKGLETKIVEVSNAPAVKTQNRFDKLKDDVIWVFIGGSLVWLVNQILGLIK